MAAINFNPDWIAEPCTTDLAYAASHVMKSDWIEPSPNPVPTAIETVQCPPHQWGIGKLLEPTRCTKCQVEKPYKPIFVGYEAHRERTVGEKRYRPMRESPR